MDLRFGNITLLHGDSAERLQSLESETFDACVTDPPYGLGDGKTGGFMGHGWDKDVPGAEVWREVYRLLKPGAHLVAFFASRTYHRGAIAIEQSGFEVRDMISWIYSQGMARGQHLGKHDPAWEGWSTCLKPAQEPIVVARKPFPGKVLDNLHANGVGAINIDACRIGESGGSGRVIGQAAKADQSKSTEAFRAMGVPIYDDTVRGMHPKNVIIDGSPEAAMIIPPEKFRSFYCAKPSRKEREAGTGSIKHPTMKPIALMEYLIRMITPPGGMILEPFMGSGTTLIAAAILGHPAFGCELSEEYLQFAADRLRYWHPFLSAEPGLFGGPRIPSPGVDTREMLEGVMPAPKPKAPRGRPSRAEAPKPALSARPFDLPPELGQMGLPLDGPF